MGMLSDEELLRYSRQILLAQVDLDGARGLERRPRVRRELCSAGSVGGASPVNGAICWRMPKDVHEEWLAADPALGETLEWETFELKVTACTSA